MYEDDPDWKPDIFKLESELILDDLVGTDDFFTAAYSEDSSQILRETYQNPIIAEKIDLNLPSGFSLTDELAEILQQDALVKDETTEDVVLSADPFEVAGCWNVRKTTSVGTDVEDDAFSPEKTSIELNYNFDNDIKSESLPLDFVEANEEIRSEEDNEVLSTSTAVETSSKVTLRSKKRTRKSLVDFSSPVFREPFDFGWRRELVYRAVNGNRRQGDVYYFTPTGKKVRSVRELQQNLAGSGLSLKNFTFCSEPLGINDATKEIIRDAKIRLSKEFVTPPSRKPVTKPKAKSIRKPVLPTSKFSPEAAIKAMIPNFRELKVKLIRIEMDSIAVKSKPPESKLSKGLLSPQRKLTDAIAEKSPIVLISRLKSPLRIDPCDALEAVPSVSIKQNLEFTRKTVTPVMEDCHLEENNISVRKDNPAEVENEVNITEELLDISERLSHLANGDSRRFFSQNIDFMQETVTLTIGDSHGEENVSLRNDNPSKVENKSSIVNTPPDIFNCLPRSNNEDRNSFYEQNLEFSQETTTLVTNDSQKDKNNSSTRNDNSTDVENEINIIDRSQISDCSPTPKNNKSDCFKVPASSPSISQNTGIKTEHISAKTYSMPSVNWGNCFQLWLKSDSEISPTISAASVQEHNHAQKASNRILQECLSAENPDEEMLPKFVILTKADASDLDNSNEGGLTQSSDSVLSQNFSCTHCPATFSSLVEFKEHYLTHTSLRCFPCLFCAAMLTSATTLQRHIKMHSDWKPFACDQCPTRFKHGVELKKHLLRHSESFVHFQANVSSSKTCSLSTENSFHCDKCPRQFKKRSKLSQHSVMHLTERNFFCDQCPKRFKGKFQLRSHLLTHGEKFYSCANCSRMFSVKCQLRAHIMRAHSTERPFACKVCAKQFKTKRLLKIHVEVHTTEIRYSCTQCTSWYKTKRALRYHLLTHSGKRYSCADCSAMFLTKGLIAQHMLTHLDKRPFSCNECSARYQTKRSFQKHQLIHSSGKAVVCE